MKNEPLLYVITTGKKNRNRGQHRGLYSGNSGKAAATQPVSGVMLSDLVKKVNPDDGGILEYFPDGMLTKEQPTLTKYAISDKRS